MSLDTAKQPGITRVVTTTTAADAIIAVIKGRNPQFCPQGLLRPPRLGSRGGYSQLAQPVPGLQRFI